MRRAFFTLIAISAVLASSLPASVHPLAAGELPQVVTGTLITVNTNADSFASGCSLRSAIQAANTDASVAGCPAGSGADTISLSDDTYTLTRTGQLEDGNQTGDLDITSDLTIQGSADISIVNANHLDRVLHVVNPNAHVTMLNVKRPKWRCTRDGSPGWRGHPEPGDADFTGCSADLKLCQAGWGSAQFDRDPGHPQFRDR